MTDREFKRQLLRLGWHVTYARMERERRQAENRSKNTAVVTTFVIWALLLAYHYLA